MPKSSDPAPFPICTECGANLQCSELDVGICHRCFYDIPPAHQVRELPLAPTVPGHGRALRHNDHTRNHHG